MQLREVSGQLCDSMIWSVLVVTRDVTCCHDICCILFDQILYIYLPSQSQRVAHAFVGEAFNSSSCNMLQPLIYCLLCPTFFRFFGNDHIAGLQSVGWLCPTQSVGCNMCRFFPCHLANLQTISSHLPTSGAHVHDTKSDVTNAHQCTDTLIHSVVCHGVARWCGHDGVPVCSYPNQSWPVCHVRSSGRRQAKLEPKTVLSALGTSPWAYFEDFFLWLYYIQ